MTSTGGSQVPWDDSSLIDDFWIDDDSLAAPKTEQNQSSSVPEPLGSKIKKNLRTQRARSITSGS
jgi:hypothetical protein